MDDVRGPAQLLHRFKHTSCEEDGPFIVVREECAVVITENLLAAEVILVVDEIDLNSC